jgi:hypothetical protein
MNEDLRETARFAGSVRKSKTTTHQVGPLFVGPIRRVFSGRIDIYRQSDITTTTGRKTLVVMMIAETGTGSNDAPNADFPADPAVEKSTPKPSEASESRLGWVELDSIESK